MSQQKKTIVVIGATGTQGGAVCKSLLTHNKNEFHVKAITRDPSKPKAKELEKLGAEIAVADLNDVNSLVPVFKNVYGVFSVQNFYETGYDGEVKQGKLVVDACKSTGVQHLVYSSVGGAERNTKIPHFDSKWEVEQYVRSSGVPFTILRPAFFFDNFINYFGKDIMEKNCFSSPLPADRALQMISSQDIGDFARLAFVNKWFGRSIEIAGDELTMTTVSEILGKHLGKKISFTPVPVDVGKMKETGSMYKWFYEYGYHAQIANLKCEHKGLMNFDEWCQKNFKGGQYISKTL